MPIKLGYPVVCQDYIDWLNDKDVTHYLAGTFGEWDLSALHAYVNRMVEHSIFRGIYADGVHVGNVKAGPISRRHKRAALGIMIGRQDMWGQGIGTRAIGAMVLLCAKQGLHSLTAGIIEGHFGAIRAFEKAGFHRVGIFHQSRVLQGEWRNELSFERVLP